MFEYALLILTSITTVAAQIMLKKTSSFIDLSHGSFYFIRSLANRYTFLSIILVLSASVFYLIALSRVDLSIAYSLMGMNYPLVVFGSSLMLRERVTKNHVFGSFFIFLGVFIFNWV